MEFWTTKLAAALLLPPAGPLLLALLGLFLARLWRRFGLTLATLGVALLWALSTPFVADPLLRLIEPKQPPELAALRNAQAIVVLGGGSYSSAPEYGGDTVGSSTLERLRWAARIHRETGLPLLVTGGTPPGYSSSEAELMKEALARDFQVPVRWAEERAATTRENALFTRDLLAKEGVHRIALVTHASHMARAHRVFEQAGFEVLDAPTAFTTRGPFSALALLPNADGLMTSRLLLHEVLGSGWYHVRRMPDDGNEGKSR